MLIKQREKKKNVVNINSTLFLEFKVLNTKMPEIAELLEPHLDYHYRGHKGESLRSFETLLKICKKQHPSYAPRSTQTSNRRRRALRMRR